MKTACALLQFVALAAVLTAYVAAPGQARMPGVRRALQTISAITGPAALPDLTIGAGV